MFILPSAAISAPLGDTISCRVNPARASCATSEGLCQARPICRPYRRAPFRTQLRQTADQRIALGAIPTRFGLETEELTMCRNIKTLFNFEPPATEAEIHASAVQFVRKLSGFNTPSKANVAAFDRAVDEVSVAARRLLASLHTDAPARDRAIEAEKARERSRARFG
jgi:hypothetical protein